MKSIEKTGSDQVTVTLTQPDSHVQPVHGGQPGHDRVRHDAGRGRRRLRQPEHRRQLHRTVRVRRRGRPGRASRSSATTATGTPTSKAKSGQVKFVFLQDPNTRVNAWKSGEVDGGWQVPSNAYAQLTNGGPGKLYYGTNTTVVERDRLQPEGPARATSGCGRRCSWRSTARGSSRPASRASPTGRSRWPPSPTGSVSRPRRSTATTRGCRSTRTMSPRRRRWPRRPASRARPSSSRPARSPSDADVLDPGHRAGRDRHRPHPEDRDRSRRTSTRRCSATRPRARGSTCFFTTWYVSIGDPMDMYGVLRTGEFSNYGDWSNAAYDAAIDAGDRHRRPRDALGLHRRRRSRSRRTSCRGCRSTPCRRPCGWARGSPACRRRSTTCTTRGRRTIGADLMTELHYLSATEALDAVPAPGAVAGRAARRRARTDRAGRARRSTRSPSSCATRPTPRRASPRRGTPGGGPRPPARGRPAGAQGGAADRRPHHRGGLARWRRASSPRSRTPW